MQLEWVSGLFEWLLMNPIEALAGKVAMLMVPLRSCDKLEITSPPWEALADQLSSTPPSIYVIELGALFVRDPNQRFLMPISTPFENHEDVSSYYQCWRSPDDDAEDGWARDVRITFTGFLKLRS